MISDSIEEYGGFLALTDDKLQCARQVGQYAFDQLIRLQFKNETNTLQINPAFTNSKGNLHLQGKLRGILVMRNASVKRQIGSNHLMFKYPR